jgi:hypothetical protein
MGIRVPGRKYNTVPGSKQLLVDEVAVADAMFQFLSGQFQVDREVVAESAAEYEINHTMQNYTIPFLEKVEDELHRTT